MDSSERIDLKIESGIADVRLNRPDKLNALDPAMFRALVDVGEQLKSMHGLRAVVLSGQGKGFCAGLDMQSMKALGHSSDSASPQHAVTNPTRRLLPRTHGDANSAQHAVLVWREIPVPVIAALHGAVLGGGFQLALAADVRYVRSDAKLSIMETKWGLVPDMGGIHLMRLLARTDVIRELTYSARVMTGDEAVRLGFATHVCADPLARAFEVAGEIAQKSPDAIRAAKRLLNLADTEGRSSILQAESHEQSALIGTYNQTESVRAVLEQRQAEFRDPG